MSNDRYTEGYEDGFDAGYKEAVVRFHELAGDVDVGKEDFISLAVPEPVVDATVDSDYGAKWLTV